MGICGLLPALKSISQRKNLREFSGQTAAVDGYCWLHRGVYSCSKELCLNQETSKYINYFIERVQFMINCGVTPYIVFDGGYLPAKALKEQERAANRAKYREEGMKFLKMGKTKDAFQCFVKAVDVTPLMAHRVILKLREMNVKYVVAPYEADAQLAFLSRNGLVDLVISEDSDCIPYRCQNILFKMDRDGFGDVININDLSRNNGLSLREFSQDMILEMCILSGCDYLPSICGLGLKKAHMYIKKYKCHKKLLKLLRFEGKLTIPLTYEKDFEKAKQTFKHQLVYDPVSKQPKYLDAIPSSLFNTSVTFLGGSMSTELATQIAEGDVDPISKDLYVNAAVCAAARETEICFSELENTKNPPTINLCVKKKAFQVKENAFTRLMRSSRSKLASAPKKRKLSRIVKEKLSISNIQTEHKENNHPNCSKFFASKDVTKFHESKSTYINNFEKSECNEVHTSHCSGKPFNSMNKFRREEVSAVLNNPKPINIRLPDRSNPQKESCKKKLKHINVFDRFKFNK